MDPLTAAIATGAVTGGAGLIGSLFQQGTSQEMAQAQYNRQAAASNTAHRREIVDLKAAGLNPILSALGNGASTPMGAMGEAQNLGEGISTGVNTALAVRSQSKELEAKDAGIANTNADTDNKAVTNALIHNQTAATAKDIEAKAMSNKIMRETLEAQIKKAKAEGDYAEVNQLMGILNSGVNSATSLINPFKGALKLPGKN